MDPAPAAPAAFPITASANDDEDDHFSDAPDLPPSSSSPSSSLPPQPKPDPSPPQPEPDNTPTTTEPPPKKQKPLSGLTSNGIGNGNGNGNGAKKAKKKANNVWTKSTSRKGKKKSKSTPNPPSLAPQDTVLVTPIPRFPDKSDDSPDSTILLSRVYKAEKVDLSDDRLTAGSTKGYRMVRATRGVIEGNWYFEIKVLKLGETGHTRLGWATEKGDLQAPVGYDGWSYGYRDIDGSKIHKALRERYGEEGYGEGDVIGFYISLPEGGKYAPKPPHLVWYKGQRYMYSADGKDEGPKVVPGK